MVKEVLTTKRAFKNDLIRMYCTYISIKQLIVLLLTSLLLF